MVSVDGPMNVTVEGPPYQVVVSAWTIVNEPTPPLPGYVISIVTGTTP